MGLKVSEHPPPQRDKNENERGSFNKDFTPPITYFLFASNSGEVQEYLL